MTDCQGSSVGQLPSKKGLGGGGIRFLSPQQSIILVYIAAQNSLVVAAERRESLAQTGDPLDPRPNTRTLFTLSFFFFAWLWNRKKSIFLQMWGICEAVIGEKAVSEIVRFTVIQL